MMKLNYNINNKYNLSNQGNITRNADTDLSLTRSNLHLCGTAGMTYTLATISAMMRPTYPCKGFITYHTFLRVWYEQHTFLIVLFRRPKIDVQIKKGTHGTHR